MFACGLRALLKAGLSFPLTALKGPRSGPARRRVSAARMRGRGGARLSGHFLPGQDRRDAFADGAPGTVAAPSAPRVLLPSVCRMACATARPEPCDSGTTPHREMTTLNWGGVVPDRSEREARPGMSGDDDDKRIAEAVLALVGVSDPLSPDGKLV